MTQPTSIDHVAAQLRSLGIAGGDVLMIHASLRSVGPAAGGAEGLIDALRRAVGNGGTLLMVLSAEDSEPFDAIRTAVDIDDMGVLAEVVRTYPGVSVNDHPADRFAAIGPAGRQLLEPVPLHDYHGPGSALERFTAYDGRVLRLGANVDTVTLTHYAEYLAEVPDKIRVRRPYVRADVGELWIESLDDTAGIATWCGGDYFPQVYRDWRSTGAVRTGPVGRCEAELFDAKPFVRFAVDWLERHLGPGAP